MIIGLSGFARVGKDEAAKALEEYGFRRVAFADKLREVLYQLDPIVSTGDQMRFDCEPRYVRLQYVIDKHGWDGYKQSNWAQEIRQLLQRLGTEAGRNVLGRNVWINAALGTKITDENIVVTDARFYNEFDAIRDRGGIIWRIERPGVGPANDHASEMEAINYPHFSYTLHNDSDLETYHTAIKNLYHLEEMRLEDESWI